MLIDSVLASRGTVSGTHDAPSNGRQKRRLGCPGEDLSHSVTGVWNRSSPHSHFVLVRAKPSLPLLSSSLIPHRLFGLHSDRRLLLTKNDAPDRFIDELV